MGPLELNLEPSIQCFNIDYVAVLLQQIAVCSHCWEKETCYISLVDKGRATTIRELISSLVPNSLVSVESDNTWGTVKNRRKVDEVQSWEFQLCSE